MKLKDVPEIAAGDKLAIRAAVSKVKKWARSEAEAQDVLPHRGLPNPDFESDEEAEDWALDSPMEEEPQNVKAQSVSPAGGDEAGCAQKRPKQSMPLQVTLYQVLQNPDTLTCNPQQLCDTNPYRRIQMKALMLNVTIKFQLLHMMLTMPWPACAASSGQGC